MTERFLVVIGAGPGLGLSVARRFAGEGFAVALLGASTEQMEPLVATLRDEGHTAEAGAIDLLDAANVSEVVGELGARHGRLDVLHFNPSNWREKDALTLSAEELLEDVMFGCAALLPAVQAAAPHMGPGARVLVTGSMAADKPSSVAPSLGVQKAAVRNLVTRVDASLAERGVRAVALQVNGMLRKEGPFAHPRIADVMWQAVTREETDWTPHVSYDG